MGVHFKTRAEAEAKAKQMLADCSFAGFKTEVWQNLHWCAAIRSPWCCVHASEVPGAPYVAFLNRSGDGSTGDSWSFLGATMVNCKSVDEAIAQRLKAAQEVIADLQDQLRRATLALGGEEKTNAVLHGVSA